MLIGVRVFANLWNKIKEKRKKKQKPASIKPNPLNKTDLNFFFPFLKKEIITLKLTSIVKFKIKKEKSLSRDLCCQRAIVHNSIFLDHFFFSQYRIYK